MQHAVSAPRALKAKIVGYGEPTPMRSIWAEVGDLKEHRQRQQTGAPWWAYAVVFGGSVLCILARLMG